MRPLHVSTHTPYKDTLTMNKTLAIMASAVVCAVSLSACNGGSANGTSGIGTIPNAASAQSSQPGGHMKSNDNGPSSIHAGGATFPAQAYNTASQPVGTFNQPQAPPGSASLFAHYGGVGTIFYCLTGSGGGRKQFDGDATRLPGTAACAGLGDTANRLRRTHRPHRLRRKRRHDQLERIRNLRSEP